MTPPQPVGSAPARSLPPAPTKARSNAISLWSAAANSRLPGALRSRRASAARSYTLRSRVVSIGSTLGSNGAAQMVHPSNGSMDNRVKQCAESIPRSSGERLQRLLMDQMKRSCLLENLRVRMPRLIAPETDLRRGAPHTKTIQYDLGQPNRKSRRHDERVQWRERLKTEQRMHQQWKDRRIPQLRRVGMRVGPWRWAILARVAAHTFGNTVVRIELREIE